MSQGEMVALEYDTHGYPLGETALNADYSRGKQYRRVLAMSERGRVTDQRLGNCVRETAGGTATFTYDANGNLVDGDGRQIGFDLMDRPVRVVMAGTTTDFAYGPSGGRYRQKITGAPGTGFGPKTVYYVDKEYELTVWDTGSASAGTLEERSFIGGSVVVLSSQSAAGVATREVRYQHMDRLGSPEAATRDDVAATLVEAHGFDPWGKPRDGSWLPSGERLHPGGEPGTTSTRGFTGHEQLDASYLTHMNGRMYDYRLGRFLSVDPIISNPANSQSINPYTYIGNNPLSGVDPTGYEPRSICEGTGAASNCSGGPAKQDPVAQLKAQIGNALDKGIVTLKTSMDDAKKTLGEGFSRLVDKVSSMFSNGGGTTTNQPGVAPSNVGSPTQVATGNAQPPAAPGQQQAATPQAPALPTAQAPANGAPGPAPGAPPYVANVTSPVFQAALGCSYGSGQCAAVGTLAGAPPTGQWVRGEVVRGNEGLPEGTLIANFRGPDGTYSSAPPWSHTAIYLGQNAQGIRVYDQWIMGQTTPHVLQERQLLFGGSGAANNGDLFYVVR